MKPVEIFPEGQVEDGVGVLGGSEGEGRSVGVAGFKVAEGAGTDGVGVLVGRDKDIVGRSDSVGSISLIGKTAASPKTDGLTGQEPSGSFGRETATLLLCANDWV